MNRLKSASLVQKWGLFGLLIGTLGFTLSMNPDHFNHMARNEGPLQSIDLAATDAAAAPAATAATGAITTTDSKKQEFKVIGKKGAFNATVFQVEGSSFVKFTSLTDVEGKNCELCNAGAMPLKSSIDKLVDLSTEVSDIVQGKGDGKDSSTKVADSKSKEFDITDWAKKCEKLSKDNALTCHKSRILELSKALKNDSDSDPIVLSYFKKYMLRPLQVSLYDTTINEISRGNCDGTEDRIAYAALFGQVGCQNLETLNTATELMTDLIRDLPSENGKSTTQTLLKLQAATFAMQLKNAESIGKEAQRERNPSKEQFALSNTLFETEMKGLISTRDRLLDSVASSSLSDSDKNRMNAVIDKTFYKPVAKMYSDQQAYIMNVTANGAPGQARSPFDFNVPNNVDGGSGLMDDTLNRNARAGTGDIGNVAGSTGRRSSAQPRGSNLPALGSGNMWNQQQGQYNPNLPVSTNFQPPPSQYPQQFNPQMSPQPGTMTPAMGRSATQVR